MTVTVAESQGPPPVDPPYALTWAVRHLWWVAPLVLGLSLGAGLDIVVLAVVLVLVAAAGLYAPAWVFLAVPLVSSAALPLVQVQGRPLDNVVIAGWLVLFAVRSSELVRTRLPAPLMAGLLGLSGAALGSALAGAAPEAALAAIRFLSYAAIVAGVLGLAPRQRSLVVRTLVATSMVVAASVILQRHGVIDGLPTFVDSESGEERFGGIVGHANFVAYTLLLTVVLLWTHRVGAMGVRLLLAAPLLYAAFSTASRTAFLAAIASFAVLALRDRRLMVMLVVGCVALLQSGTQLAQRLINFTETGGFSGDNNASFRLQQWADALALHEWWEPFGVGWNQTAQILPNKLGVHSGYVQIPVELGLVGVVAFIGYCVGVLMLAKRVGIGGLALASYVLVANLGDPALLYPAVTHVLVVALAADHRALAPLVRSPVASTEAAPVPDLRLSKVG